MIFNHNLKQKISFCLAGILLAGEMLLLGNILAVNAQQYVSYSQLGDITHYNGIVFDEFVSYKADIEGALAVGGYGEFGIEREHGYDIGAAGDSHFSSKVQIGEYKNPNGYPTLLYNGEDMQVGYDSNDTTVKYQIYDGSLIMSPTMKESYDKMLLKFDIYGMNSGINITSKEILNLWFQNQYKKSVNISGELVNANDEAINFYDFYSGNYLKNLDSFRNQNLWLNTQGNPNKNVLVININTEDNILLDDSYRDTGNWETSTNATVYYSKVLQSYDLVIFNFVDAVNVKFDSFGIFDDDKKDIIDVTKLDLVRSYSKNILWNFPKAKSIVMNQFAMLGSVLAPDAKVEADGGAINGQLICSSFTTKGSMELHNIPVPPGVFEPDEEEEVEQNITIFKYANDESGRIPLEGAVFSLYDKDGNEITTEVSDYSGFITFENLSPGCYSLIEIKPPEGYWTKGQDIDFEISDNGEVTWKGDYSATTGSKVEVSNEPLSEKTIEILKIDSETKLPLEGGKFTLYRAKEKTGELQAVGLLMLIEETAEIVSTETEIGTEIVAETEAADIIEEVIEAETEDFREDALESRLPIYEDEIIETDDFIDMDKLTEQSEFVGEEMSFFEQPAALTTTFVFMDTKVKSELEDEVEWEKMQTFSTTKNGTITIENLKPGMYRLVETKAPAGYLINDEENEWFFFIDTDGQIEGVENSRLTIENKKEEGETESSTEAPTEPITEEPTEPATEEPTEPPTEEPTEPATEEPTEPATEEPTEPPTEEPTEPATEEPTEPPTEAPTEPTAEEPTEPTTEESTAPTTEEATAPTTQEPTEPAPEETSEYTTEVPTQPEPTKPGNTRPPKDSGSDNETTATETSTKNTTEGTSTEEEKNTTESEMQTETSSNRRPPGYTFEYNSERDEYLVIDPEGVPLGYVKNPDLFVPEIPKTRDNMLTMLITIILVGGLAAGLAIINIKRKLDK